MTHPQRLPHLLLLVVSAVLWATACATETDAPGTDSNTNWLTQCAGDDQCGPDYACICGLCTLSCSDDSSCSVADEQAVCWRAEDAPSSCGADAQGQLCLLPCHDGVCRNQLGSTPGPDSPLPSAGTPPSVPTAPDPNGGTPPAVPDVDPVVPPQPGTGDSGASNAPNVAPEPEPNPDGDDPNPDAPSGTGGTGGTGGTSGTGGMDGTGGTDSMQSCDEGCEELCEGGACDCVCAPDVDFAACDDTSECIVIGDCCSCQEVVAVHREQAEARTDAVCPGDVQCERCLEPGDPGYVPGNDDSRWSPSLVAECIEGSCVVVDQAGSGGMGGAPSDTPREDGEPCSEASDCDSGVCEGLGCEPEQGTCVPQLRACTSDLVSFCGCDGVTFEGSSTCPGGRYQSLDACAEN